MTILLLDKPSPRGSAGSASALAYPIWRVLGGHAGPSLLLEGRSLAGLDPASRTNRSAQRAWFTPVVRAFIVASIAALALPVAAQSNAFVEQLGLRHGAALMPGGVENSASLSQVGNEHVARLDQSDGSTATIEQDGLGHRLAGLTSGVADPTAFALQNGASALVLRQFGGQNSQAFVDQRDGAYAEILQFGSDNLTLLSQSGGQGNQAFVEQNGGALAEIVQSGADNVAHVLQSGGLDNEAYINQTGAGGLARITQTGADNEARVTQSGIPP